MNWGALSQKLLDKATMVYSDEDEKGNGRHNFGRGCINAGSSS